jgi:hypothetical protein
VLVRAPQRIPSREENGMDLSITEINIITRTPAILIREPIMKAISEFFELLLIDNPVCNPIIETNNEEPSLENVFSAACTFDTICALVSRINRFRSKPAKMDTNRIPDTPREMPLMRILPIANPRAIMKSSILNGDSIVAK